MGARVGICPKAIENTDIQPTDLSDIIGSYDECWRRGLCNIAESFTDDSWRLYRRCATKQHIKLESFNNHQPVSGHYHGDSSEA